MWLALSLQNNCQHFCLMSICQLVELEQVLQAKTSMDQAHRIHIQIHPPSESTVLLAHIPGMLLCQLRLLTLFGENLDQSHLFIALHLEVEHEYLAQVSKQI